MRTISHEDATRKQHQGAGHEEECERETAAGRRPPLTLACGPRRIDGAPA